MKYHNGRPVERATLQRMQHHANLVGIDRDSEACVTNRFVHA
jgi:hypothetical protein